MHFHGHHTLDPRLALTCSVLDRKMYLNKVLRESLVGEGKKSDLSKERVWPFLEDIHMEQTYGIPDSETGTQDKVSGFL